MNGTHFTLGLVGALAAAGALSRRGAANKSGAPWERPEVAGAAKEILRLLGLKDVRVGEKGQIYLIGSPRKLEGLLRGAGRYGVQRMLSSCGVDRMGIRSYMDNLDHWDGLFDAVSLFLEEKGVKADPEKEYASWSIELIPEPGRPAGRTWSALKGKVLSDEKFKAFRFCDQPSVPLGDPLGPVLVSMDENKIPPLFLSHGVTLEGLEEVDRCGGFLWPSIALTWRVPEGYGDVVFLADTQLLPEILKPSGKPSNHKHLYLAGTDIWSPTAKDLAKTQAQIAKQMRGESDRGLQSDLLLSGASKANWDNLVGTFSYVGNDAKATDRIETRSALVKAMRAILDEHTHGPDPYTYPEERHRRYQASYRYPYAEMKVVGVVKPSSMVACLYPKSMARKVHAMLDKIGFQGFRIPFDWDKGPRSGWVHDQRTHTLWASAATKALLAWSKRPCDTPGVRVGAAHEQQVEAPYEAEFSFYNGYKLSFGYGVFASSNVKRGRCAPPKRKT